ncbi:unnamed protein product [Laminaria digitata]
MPPAPLMAHDQLVYCQVTCSEKRNEPVSSSGVHTKHVARKLSALKRTKTSVAPENGADWHEKNTPKAARYGRSFSLTLCTETRLSVLVWCNVRESRSSPFFSRGYKLTIRHVVALSFLSLLTGD